MCKYGKSCRKKLCSFRHDLAQKDYEDELKEAFEKLSDEEQYESKEVLCDDICAAPDGYHKCWPEGFERFAGCELTNYTVDYDETEMKVVKSFPCEKCNEKFQQWENLKEQFTRTHGKKEMICCPVKECEFETKLVNNLIMHIGVYHKD